MCCNVDYGLLSVVCAEALGNYEWVPIRHLKRDYNLRCGVGWEVRNLSGLHLERGLSLVGGGEVSYRVNGIVSGVVRNENIKPSVPANQLLTEKIQEAKVVKVVRVGKNFHTGIVLEVWNGKGVPKVESE